MAKAMKRIPRTVTARKLRPYFALGRQALARRARGIRSIIRAFGSPKALADWCGVEPSAVNNWLTEGLIPPGLHPARSVCARTGRSSCSGGANALVRDARRCAIRRSRAAHGSPSCISVSVPKFCNTPDARPVLAWLSEGRAANDGTATPAGSQRRVG
jgi:hypothetical protein